MEIPMKKTVNKEQTSPIKPPLRPTRHQQNRHQSHQPLRG